MKAIVKFSSNINLEIEEKDEMETLNKAITLGNPRNRCDACGNTTRFYFSSNKDKEGNTYVNRKCGECGASSKLGRYKTSGFFWHSYEKYVPKGETDEGE
jgi:hypothetical protein